MDKKDKMLIIYAATMIALLIIIRGSVFLNSFQTPFSMGDQYTPWETEELKSILQPGSYTLSGLKTSNYTNDGNGHYIDNRDNRYIVPTTFFAKIICRLFRWRVKFAFLASLTGIILFITYQIKYKKKKYSFWIKASLALVHICFFATAFWSTLCTRWWGYG